MVYFFVGLDVVDEVGCMDGFELGLEDGSGLVELLFVALVGPAEGATDGEAYDFVVGLDDIDG